MEVEDRASVETLAPGVTAPLVLGAPVLDLPVLDARVLDARVLDARVLYGPASIVLPGFLPPPLVRKRLPILNVKVTVRRAIAAALLLIITEWVVTALARPTSREMTVDVFSAIGFFIGIPTSVYGAVGYYKRQGRLPRLRDSRGVSGSVARLLLPDRKAVPRRRRGVYSGLFLRIGVTLLPLYPASLVFFRAYSLGRH